MLGRPGTAQRILEVGTPRPVGAVAFEDRPSPAQRITGHRFAVDGVADRVAFAIQQKQTECVRGGEEESGRSLDIGAIFESGAPTTVASSARRRCGACSCAPT